VPGKGEGGGLPLPHRILDCAKWDSPLCTIIVTHHNYSNVIEDALLSLLNQTYTNWECIIVDDYSTVDECHRAQAIVEKLSDGRLRFMQNNRQHGQIEAFFAGLAETAGEFVSPLDPDDRLNSVYLQEMVSAHLNETVFAPIVCCDQKILRINEALVTGTLVGARWKGDFHLPTRDVTTVDLLAPTEGALLYFPCTERGWLWTTTSSMMVRRPAANLLIPQKQLDYKVALDAYLAFGTHFLGGTLFLRRPLVYRGVHANNDYINEHLFSMVQHRMRADAKDLYPHCRRDVVESMFHNGVSRLFSEQHLTQLLRHHFKEREIASIGKRRPEVLKLCGLPEIRKVPGRFKRLKKRARKVPGIFKQLRVRGETILGKSPREPHRAERTD